MNEERTFPCSVCKKDHRVPYTTKQGWAGKGDPAGSKKSFDRDQEGWENWSSYYYEWMCPETNTRVITRSYWSGSNL